jgi:HTH-type transcriptional regulator, sugar sensing transcriptional regulator
MGFEQLKELGLTEGEIKVYTALLRIGLSTKGPIAHTSGISESKIYEVLERLKAKGLVSYVAKKQGKREIVHYKPANPTLLKEFLEKKRQRITAEETILTHLLPSLQAQLQSQEQEYSAVVYEGFKGIQTNLKEVLEMIDKNDEWVAMGTQSGKAHEYNLYWVNWLKQRAQKGGKARILFVDKGWYYDQVKSIKNTKVGYLPSIAPASVVVTKNRVMIFTYGKTPGCLAITNDDIAESFKGFFESIWTLAEK